MTIINLRSRFSKKTGISFDGYLTVNKGVICYQKERSFCLITTLKNKIVRVIIYVLVPCHRPGTPFLDTDQDKKDT